MVRYVPPRISSSCPDDAERDRTETRSEGSPSLWQQERVWDESMSAPLRQRVSELFERARRVLRSAPTDFQDAMQARPVSTLAMILGTVLVTRLFAMQLSTIHLPIFVYDGHQWRQSFTYGVAWNYAHTTLDVLRPRMFAFAAKGNVVAMEAPLYPLIASIFLRIGNDSIIGPRLISWLALVATAGVLFRFLGTSRSDPRDVWSDRAGLLIALSLSTMVACEFRSVQPEPMAAGMSMLAAAAFVRYRDSERRSDAIRAGVFTLLALLAKPSVLGIIPGLILFAVWGRGRWRRRLLVSILAVLPGLLLYMAWDRWALRLQTVDLDGEVTISIAHDWRAMLRNLASEKYRREAFLHFLPNYAGSWWLVPAFAAGVFRGLSEPRLRRFGVPFFVWMVGFFVELLAFGDRLHSNAYYFILAPAPVAFFCALGLGAFFRMLESSRERPPLNAWRLGLVVALLLPLGLLTAKPARWGSIDFVHLGFWINRNAWTSDLALGGLVALLIVLLAVAPMLRPKRIPKYVGIVVLFGVMATGYWALRDEEQYLRFYTSIGRRGRFSVELAELRTAVNRYTRPEEPIAIGEPELFVFYYALRNGYTVDDDKKSRAKLEAARQGGARLFLHTSSREEQQTPLRVRTPALAEGPWWSLHCIDPNGCAPLR
jgi:hypothetical protein